MAADVSVTDKLLIASGSGRCTSCNSIVSGLRAGPVFSNLKELEICDFDKTRPACQ